MYYFGRIIGAFFNQLFRFLFWNKFGQKILIAIIIGFIAFWCVGMTKVHAVEEVSDINYEVKSYYDGLVNKGILYMDLYLKANPNGGLATNIKSGDFKLYFYTGNIDGSSYNNARPLNATNMRILCINQSNFNTGNISNYDYLGVTSYTMYQTLSNANLPIYTLSNKGELLGFSYYGGTYYPNFVLTYEPSNLTNYLIAYKNNDTATMIQLLEDIKAEQQATNDFLSEPIDETGISVQAPAVTDTASENMSNNLHNQINTLTTSLQSTVNNYYEGWDAYVWTIPLPQYIGGNISFDSGVTRRIIGSNGVVFNVIQAIWVILFGGYIVGFIKRMLDWIQTGKIFDEGGLADFIWWMDTNNEIIKASMM